MGNQRRHRRNRRKNRAQSRPQQRPAAAPAPSNLGAASPLATAVADVIRASGRESFVAVSQTRATVVAVIKCRSNTDAADLKGTIQDLINTYHPKAAPPTARKDGDFPPPPEHPPGRVQRRTETGVEYLDENADELEGVVD